MISNGLIDFYLRYGGRAEELFDVVSNVLVTRMPSGLAKEGGPNKLRRKAKF
jgi:hypothetical protein